MFNFMHISIGKGADYAVRKRDPVASIATSKKFIFFLLRSNLVLLGRLSSCPNGTPWDEPPITPAGKFRIARGTLVIIHSTYILFVRTWLLP